MKKKKIANLHRVLTPEDEKGIEVATLARFGASNYYLKGETGLSDSQITYALRKAKCRLGYKPGHTLRSEWRNGTSSLFRAMVNAAAPSVREEVVHDICVPIAKPTPQFSNKGRRGQED